MRNKVFKLIACSKISWNFLRYMVNSHESNVCSESFAFSQYLDVLFMFGIKLRIDSANSVPTILSSLLPFLLLNPSHSVCI